MDKRVPQSEPVIQSTANIRMFYVLRWGFFDRLRMTAIGVDRLRMTITLKVFMME